MTRLAKETVRSIYGEAAGCADEYQRKRLADWGKQSESERRLRNMIELAKSEPGIPVRPGDLDAEPMQFCVLNGTLDLRDLTLSQHEPEHLITRQTAVAYEPTARAPLWEAFLTRIFEEDESLVGFVQRAVGYSLTGTADEQVFFLLYGVGANGKSVFIRTLLSLFGAYGQAADFSTFLLRRNERPRNDLARLAGARLVVAAEAAEGQRFDEELLKRVTGGDRIAARYLYAEEFEFTASFTVWLAANHRPAIRGCDHAIWRRVVLIPFGVTVPESERDPHLAEKLREELSGILRWAVEGLQLYQRCGLGRPPAVLAAVEDYRVSSDVLAEFLETRCVLGLRYRASAADLFADYQSWARETAEHSLSRTAFGERLRERGLLRVKSHGAIVWHGIRLSHGSVPGGDGETGGEDLRELSHTGDSNEGPQNGLPNPPLLPRMRLAPSGAIRETHEAS